MQRFRSQSTGALNSIFSTPSTRRRSQANLNHSSNSLNSPEISPRSSRKDHLREAIDGSLVCIFFFFVFVSYFGQ